jgi:uncharacterized membrane protein
MMQLQPRTGTSLGWSERAERVLTYLIPVLSALFFLVVEQNRSVRRHARQAITIFLPIVLIWLILGFLGGLLTPIPILGFLLGSHGLFGFVAGLVWWIGVVLWLLLMLVAFVTDAVFVQPRRRGI